MFPQTSPSSSRRAWLKWWAVVIGCGWGHWAWLLANVLRVPATYGYDWPGHFTYLYYLAAHGTLPDAGVSAQFFNPPLYYVCVVAFQRLTGVDLARAGQLFNLLVALLSYAVLVGVCRRLWGARLLPLVWGVGFYVSNPVIYRTFGMMRPEVLLILGFLLAGWLVAKECATHCAVETRPVSFRFALLSGGLAALAFCTRQWGGFLEVALWLWLLVVCWPRLRSSATRWAGIGLLGIQALVFGALVGGYLWYRGASLWTFNAPPHAFDPAFLTRLELGMLFTHPIRPALNGRFWPTLYADFWGDYWRYWREALWHDPLPTSAGTVRALARAMWAGLPVTLLLGIGVIFKPGKSARLTALTSSFHLFARLLIAISLGGFVVFASRYADPLKGDTVKSVYIVYLVPYCAWLLGGMSQWLTTVFPRYPWVSAALLVLLAIFVAPQGLYQAPSRMLSRTWNAPDVSCPITETFGDAITLVGCDWALTEAADSLTATLVWRSDAYVPHSYKVFVHLLGAEGQVLAQSDAVPAAWQRPTYAWMVGEYIEDVHALTVMDLPQLDGMSLRVGLYNEGEGQRLSTTQGQEYALIYLNPF